VHDPFAQLEIIKVVISDLNEHVYQGIADGDDVVTFGHGQSFS
jgi:hypothetical protein